MFAGSATMPHFRNFSMIRGRNAATATPMAEGRLSSGRRNDWTPSFLGRQNRHTAFIATRFWRLARLLTEFTRPRAMPRASPGRHLANAHLPASNRCAYAPRNQPLRRRHRLERASTVVRIYITDVVEFY
jgi:hypothetical protein